MHVQAHTYTVAQHKSQGLETIQDPHIFGIYLFKVKEDQTYSLFINYSSIVT